MQCPTCHSVIDSEAAYCPFCGERVSDGPIYDEYDYEAFISYRHLPRDRKVAVKLQRRLEGMAIPRGIKTDDGRTKLGKLFRDEDELPTSSSLPDQIREALKRSRYLVVICSPETGESAWVQREVELFASFHGRARVRIVLAAGEPEESFPPLLRSRLTVDENGDIISVEEEPLAADLRSDDRKRFRSESLRIAAPLIGCGYDDLVQRQHARRMRLIAIATSVVAAVSTAFGSFSLYQQRQIERNYRLTQINESEARAVQSQELLAAGDRMEAIEVALAALPESSTSGDRPFVPAAQIALEQATYAYAPDNYWRSCYNLKGMKSLYATSDRGLQANLTKKATIQVSRIVTGLPICTIDYVELIGSLTSWAVDDGPSGMVFCGENLVIVSSRGKFIVLCDSTTGEMLWHANMSEAPGTLWGEAVSLSSDDALLAAGIRSEDESGVPYVYVCLIDSATGEKVQTFELSLKGTAQDDVTSDVRTAFSPDDQCLAVSCSKSLWSINLKDGTVSSASLAQNDAFRLAYYDDAIVSVTAEDSAANLYVGSSYFDVFSPDLKPLWSKQETPSYHINSHMAGISNNTHVIGDGTFNDGAPMLVYAAGNEVRLVELLTGEQRMGLSLNAPVRAACLIDDGLLNVVDAGGTLTSYLIMEGSSYGLTPNSTIQVAEGDYASLTSVGRVYYAAVWDPETDRYRIYQCVLPTKNIAGYEVIGGLNGFKLWFSGGPHKDFPENTPLVVKNDTEIGILDQESFQLRWAIQKDALGLGENFDMTTTAGRLYAYTTWSVNNECVVLELSWETGEVINRYVFPCDEYGWIRINKIRVFDFDGVTTLALAVDGTEYIWCFSLEDLTPMACVGPLDGTVLDFYLVNDVVTVAFKGSPQGHFEMYQLTDGAPLSNALSSLAPAFTSNASHYVAFSWDEDLMLVCCADGNLRCLNTQSWDVNWEQEVDNVQIATFSLDGRYVLVQDTTGTCVMLDAETGETLRASSVTLPLIDFFVYDPSDPTRIDATCVYSSLSISEFFFVSFSLDDDAFGPTALVRFGAASSSSRDEVLSYDIYQSEFGIQRLHTLDELIALGHEQLQGHELTEVERQLLRIDE